MNVEQRTQFVRELINATAKNIITAAADAPDNWDGHELRELVADWFNANRMCRDKRRLRNYRNHGLTNNLLP